MVSGLILAQHPEVVSDTSSDCTEIISQPLNTISAGPHKASHVSMQTLKAAQQFIASLHTILSLKAQNSPLQFHVFMHQGLNRHCIPHQLL